MACAALATAVTASASTAPDSAPSTGLLPRPDLDDLPVLPGDVGLLERRAVDREHPAGGERLPHVSSAGLVFNRRSRRSSSEQSKIEPS